MSRLPDSNLPPCFYVMFMTYPIGRKGHHYKRLEKHRSRSKDDVCTNAAGQTTAFRRQISLNKLLLECRSHCRKLMARLQSHLMGGLIDMTMKQKRLVKICTQLVSLCMIYCISVLLY